MTNISKHTCRILKLQTLQYLGIISSYVPKQIYCIVNRYL